MSAPAVDELDPATVRGLLARASDPQRERWLQQVRRTGACRHPVRLRGVVLRGDEPVYSTASEPDGALMVRCGNRARRAARVARTSTAATCGSSSMPVWPAGA